MTFYMKIHCDYCGGTWEVYDNIGDYTTTAARTCPHCGTKVDRQTWLRQIIPAFCAVGDANRELIKDHLDHRPLFSVDIIAVHRDKHNPYKDCPNID